MAFWIRISSWKTDPDSLWHKTNVLFLSGHHFFNDSAVLKLLLKVLKKTPGFDPCSDLRLDPDP